MNWQQVEGQWKELGAEIKSRWAKLTDDDVMSMSAKKDKLVAKLEQRYGLVKDEAERQVDDWLARLSPPRGGRNVPPRS